MMKFEIINPSDKAYIEADCPKVACMATIFFSQGYYGLQEVDGDFEMPVFILGGANEWFHGKFGLNIQALYDGMDKDELSKALLSVHLAGERTSMNDIVQSAHAAAAHLKGDDHEQTQETS
jgi:hypothetical protein